MGVVKPEVVAVVEKDKEGSASSSVDGKTRSDELSGSWSLPVVGWLAAIFLFFVEDVMKASCLRSSGATVWLRRRCAAATRTMGQSG